MASILELPGTVDITGSYRVSAIYFLCHDDEILYVGKTENLFSRILNHEGNRDKKFANSIPFTQVFMLKCPKEHLQATEDYYIAKLRPPYNKAPLRTSHPNPPPIFRAA